MRKFLLLFIITPFIIILVAYGPVWPFLVIASLAILALVIVEVDELMTYRRVSRRHSDKELAKNVKGRL